MNPGDLIRPRGDRVLKDCALIIHVFKQTASYRGDVLFVFVHGGFGHVWESDWVNT